MIERAVVALLEISHHEREPEAWHLIADALADLRDGLDMFRESRRTRKVTVFGSARTTPDDPSYQLATALAQEAVRQGFAVMTGAGGGVMEAANLGAGQESSFGLNVDLPFEQHANRTVSGPAGRLLHFRYFFTRKLFFLRESDALVVLPGGFGTLDELFEALTLIQTGRTRPIPLVLLAPPANPFWRGWQRDVQQGLAAQGLISPEDPSLLLEATSAQEAIALISRFYRVFHTAQPGEDRLELLLHSVLPAAEVQRLNLTFADLVAEGQITAGESCDEAGRLYPCLRFHLDKRRIGRLYQLIDHLNGLDLAPCAALQHPGERQLRTTNA
ncbi:MAG: LOG family protein [Cyanobacteriota bacterium]|nr:LOG family protein [Cyanobacteriota bacterium]